MAVKGSGESGSKGKLHWLSLHSVFELDAVSCRIRARSTTLPSLRPYLHLYLTDSLSNLATSSRTICLNFAFTHSFSISAIRRYRVTCASNSIPSPLPLPTGESRGWCKKERGDIRKVTVRESRKGSGTGACVRDKTSVYC